MKMKLAHPDLAPERKHGGDAGLDLKTSADILLEPGEMRTMSTGVSLELPAGYVGYLHIRSGVSSRDGVALLNGTGVIDFGYRGEISLPLINLGRKTFTARRGERIAQLVVHKIALPDIEIVDELSSSERGLRGLGSTGR